MLSMGESARSFYLDSLEQLVFYKEVGSGSLHVSFMAVVLYMCMQWDISIVGWSWMKML